MMLKSKICLTVLVVYEILAVILVHMTRICTAMFGTNFCADNGFKYFIACFAVPALAFLVWLWIREIIVTTERRHSFVHKAKDALTDMMDDVKDRFAGTISAKDIEKFLAAAAIVGIRRYAQTHPHTKRMFDNIVATARGEETADYDDEYEDDDDDEYENEDVEHVSYAEYQTSANPQRNGRSGTGRTHSARGASAARRGGGTKARIKK